MAHALIVDDDPDVRSGLKSLRRPDGGTFAIARAHSLREAQIELGRQTAQLFLTRPQIAGR